MDSKLVLSVLYIYRIIHVSFVFSADYMDYFLLDPKTGELRTAKPLDKEALDDSTGVINITVRVGIIDIIHYVNTFKISHILISHHCLTGFSEHFNKKKTLDYNKSLLFD